MEGTNWTEDWQKMMTTKRDKYPGSGPLCLSKSSLANVLRNIEQTQLGECQNSEYLTLLSSFPDVKKSD